jgi:superfamily II DNA/RNA helicase
MVLEARSKSMTDSPPDAFFDSLGLSPQLLDAMRLAGHERGTPVQVATIPAVLAGQDVKARAETGTGKTLAFGLPLLQQLSEQPRAVLTRGNTVTMLVLVPTRELALQVAGVLAALARSLPDRIKVLAVFGGVKINPQMMALRGGADILVATPGRLLDLRRKNAVEFGSLRVLVLDEADRLLGLGFHDELQGVLALLPTKRQTLLFSATFPANMEGLVQELLHAPKHVELAPVATTALIDQHIYTVDPTRKRALLIHLIREQELHQVLVFVSAKRTADRLSEKLVRAGLSAGAFHGDRSQAERQRALRTFRDGTLRVLVATDLAARGIDIEALPVVINFELPRSPNDYTHRIGRTGRAGSPGLALTLICPEEFHHFGVIEKRINRRLEREQVAGFELGTP